MSSGTNNSSVFSGPTIVTGGTFTLIPGTSQKGGFELLTEASAPEAFYNSAHRFDPPKCHPNTRVAVLETIADWVQGTSADPARSRAFMMWLYGAAGVGKSAIAHTISEQFDGDCLLGTFLFSRTDSARNNAQHLVATIAYQIALVISEVKEFIVAAVDHDPLIFSKSLEIQFSYLIFEPLRTSLSSNHPKSRSRYLIVLDGLDECLDKDERCYILRLLIIAKRQGALPPVLRFLIASRPELDIKTVFNSQDRDTRPFYLALDNNYSSDADILLFFQEKFEEIKRHHPFPADIPSTWPSQNTINKLVQTSSGQFIYASTVVKYVSSQARKPTTSLDVILGLRPARSGTPSPRSTNSIPTYFPRLMISILSSRH